MLWISSSDLEGPAAFPDVSSRGTVNVPVELGFVDKSPLPAKYRDMELYCSDLFRSEKKQVKGHLCGTYLDFWRRRAGMGPSTLSIIARCSLLS